MIDAKAVDEFKVTMPGDAATFLLLWRIEGCQAACAGARGVV
jgi:hypothetical protein